ncbi:MAG: ADP-forming succinate--CoA ligase subunit beta [Firmicutes bacterium]|nr:ADP-forming succinate--CoA ligase subunit beta [Bacillota bacterium]
MKLLEYQAQTLMKMYGVPVPGGCVIAEGADIESELAGSGIGYPAVVKAQVQIGGRGKAGGIRFAQDAAQAKREAEDLLGKEIRGLTVHKVYLVEKQEYVSEWYLSILLDRLSKQPMILFSSMGGMEIEETAKTAPDKIKRIVVDPMIGVEDYMARYLLSSSGLDVSCTKALDQLLKGLYRCFREKDCMLAEINPLVVREDGKLIALDGKIDVDDSALYRQPEVKAWREELPEEDLVKEAREFDFLYIPIEKGGSVAVCSNGSGMLMSCIDMLSKNGMVVSAALDLGGGATKERIAEALRILFATQGVKAVLINIFGGITRCDEVAGGIELAMSRGALEGKMIVVRMEGTNKDKAIELLNGMKNDDVIRVDGLRESIAAMLERRDRL